MPRKPRRTGERAVTASEAAKNFGALVDRVRSERASYVVERAGAPVVRIEPVDTFRYTLGDLAAWFRSREPIDPRFADEVERAVKTFNEPSVPREPWER